MIRCLAVMLLATACVAGCDEPAEGCDVGAFAVQQQPVYAQAQFSYAQPQFVQAQFSYAQPQVAAVRYERRYSPSLQTWSTRVAQPVVQQRVFVKRQKFVAAPPIVVLDRRSALSVNRQQRSNNFAAAGRPVLAAGAAFRAGRAARFGF